MAVLFPESTGPNTVTWRHEISGGATIELTRTINPRKSERGRWACCEITWDDAQPGDDKWVSRPIPYDEAIKRLHRAGVVAIVT